MLQVRGLTKAYRAGNGQDAIAVRDQGVGIPRDLRSVIFDPFRRLDGVTPGHGRGLGLGLWIVRSIVERHGGRIAVSRPDDARTRFALTLPVAEGDA